MGVNAFNLLDSVCGCMRGRKERSSTRSFVTIVGSFSMSFGQSPYSTSYGQSADTCDSCVDRGCTWCKADSFFNGGTGSSACACGFNGGFFGGCSDVSFGSSPLESGLDCTFGTEFGELVLAAIIIGVVLILCCVGCCVYSKYRSSTSGRPVSFSGSFRRAQTAVFTRADASRVHPTATSPAASGSSPLPQGVPHVVPAHVPAATVVPAAATEHVPAHFMPTVVAGTLVGAGADATPVAASVGTPVATPVPPGGEPDTAARLARLNQLKVRSRRAPTRDAPQRDLPVCGECARGCEAVRPGRLVEAEAGGGRGKTRPPGPRQNGRCSGGTRC